MLSLAWPADARDRAIGFAVPAGPLGTAIVAIGAQAGVTIGVADPMLGRLPVRGVAGRMTLTAALRHLLSGTAADFVAVDPQTFQIIRRKATPKPPRPSRPETQAAAIVVTGSKRSAALDDYAGSVMMVDTSSLRPGRLVHGSEALVEQLPLLSSTHLGPGRNKLFIRGVADSSFNGPTQATVGQYLGEVRLNYSAPDPNLALYDVASVEVLEGPQGTLYGAGSLGGVIRLVPTSPDLDHASLSLSGGGSLTAHGAPGGDGAVIGNVPLVSGRLALRTLVYANIDGGYIDDPLRHLTDINRTFTRGGRGTLRYQPATDWTIDLGGVVQNIDGRDGQYTTRGLPPLERESVIAQPFDNDYALASLVVRHEMGATSFVSATSAVWHDVGSTFDASPSPASPLRYREEDHISLVTNETRLSHRASTGGGWVIGGELLRSVDQLDRTLGPPGAESSLSGTSNTAEQASVFGEATIRFAPRWFLVGGARLGFSRLVGDALNGGGDNDQHRTNVALLPSIGLLWKVSGRLSLYARYQEGYRPGGLSVQSGGAQHYRADSVATSEIGLRYGRDADRFGASLAGSFAHWEDIQADLVDSSGFPYTTNIGSGRILGLEARAHWRPFPGLAIEAALFADDSNLTKPAAAFVGESDATLPNIADLIAHLGFRYDIHIAGRSVELSGSAHYVGRSRLGVGPALDLHQGRYVDTALGLSAPIGRATVSLDATNLFDVRGNSFALGNPFGVMAGTQMTPMRPRTIRLGFALGF